MIPEPSIRELIEQIDIQISVGRAPKWLLCKWRERLAVLLASPEEGKDALAIAPLAVVDATAWLTALRADRAWLVDMTVKYPVEVTSRDYRRVFDGERDIDQEIARIEQALKMSDESRSPAGDGMPREVRTADTRPASGPQPGSTPGDSQPPLREGSPDRTVTTHELKCWPEFFSLLLAGVKPFEIRRNDRDYMVGDVLWLREWEPGTASYSGRDCRRVVTCITAHEQKPGYVVMGLRELAPATPLSPTQLLRQMTKEQREGSSPERKAPTNDIRSEMARGDLQRSEDGGHTRHADRQLHRRVAGSLTPGRTGPDRGQVKSHHPRQR